jgi:dihydrofolate synthase/folylpolyglutamate synthase
VKRALHEADLKFLASKAGLYGKTYADVSKAFEAAKANASNKDFIFVGGSSFVVADLLTYLEKNKKQEEGTV